MLMAQRITIMLDDDLHQKIHDRQAALIKKHNSSYSFSKVINEVLRGKVRL